ncbi:MAG: hypothetical protein L0211_21770 [Planctomycetaceae bacterium]|nr:hypothetical protein [Planctomycetaceae bacterium]
MRFSVRDLLWLTVVVALAVGWWIDRAHLAFRSADYRRLKTVEAEELKQRAEFFRMLRQTPVSSPADDDLYRGGQRRELGDEKLGPDGLRHVPGEKDFLFPPNYPLHYGPSRSP